jgi:hypothetical protein
VIFVSSQTFNMVTSSVCVGIYCSVSIFNFLDYKKEKNGNRIRVGECEEGKM